MGRGLKITALAPTFGRSRRLLANSLACFEAQTYPADRRRLFIFADDGDTPESCGDGWKLVQRAGGRSPNLGAKYNEMVAADDWADAFVVWDTDDVYLPQHVEAIAAALESAPWAHPEFVWSTYANGPNQPGLEGARGRFHGSLAVRRDALESVGGWVDTRRADFDQLMLSRLTDAFGPPVDPSPNRPTYVFRWADTNEPHCQSLMSSPNDETWYAGVKRQPWGGDPLAGGTFDESAAAILRNLEGRHVSREKPDQLRFVRTVELTAAAAALAGRVPAGTVGVVGVPRSGLAVAAIVALHLHLPLLTVTRAGVVSVGHGARFEGRWDERVDARGRGLAVVDDSVCNGHVSRRIRQLCPDAWFGAAFVTRGGAAIVDGFVDVIAEPHLFEWNLLNSGMFGAGSNVFPWLVGGVACDFDGVFCQDCPPGHDGDDTVDQDARYIHWLHNAQPKHLPRRAPCPLVATWRLSRFATITRDWCERWGAMVDRWAFCPAQTFRERATMSPAEFKGRAFLDSAAGLFIESDERQAPTIASVAGKPVIALDSGKVFCGK